MQSKISAVRHGLENASVMLADARLDYFAETGFQGRQRRGLVVRHDLAVSGLGEAQLLKAAKVEGDEWGRCSIIQLRWWPWAVSSSFGWVCSPQLWTGCVAASSVSARLAAQRQNSRLK